MEFFSLNEFLGNNLLGEDKTKKGKAPSVFAAHMVLDSQAVEHLELTESTNQRNLNKGTLFSFIDHTNTAFGKRMLKRWLLAPLNDVTKL